jgi:hypothetical protein
MNEQITTQPTASAPEAGTAPTVPAAVTVKLPKINWQMTALVLIALVAAFQTFQLATLKGKVSVKPAAASVGPASAAPANNAGLQSMVGGC